MEPEIKADKPKMDKGTLAEIRDIKTKQVKAGEVVKK